MPAIDTQRGGDAPPRPSTPRSVAAADADEYHAGSRPAMVANCTLRSRTSASALWASAYAVPSKPTPQPRLSRSKESGGEAEPLQQQRFEVAVERAPPAGATPCVRIHGARVCLGYTDVLLPGTYKRTSYQ